MEYLNVVNENYLSLVSNSILYPKIKIELLDEYERPYRELIEDISSQNQGSITCQLQQGIRKTISFSIFDPSKQFLPNPNNDLFWINKKFKIYLGLIKKRAVKAPEMLSPQLGTLIVDQINQEKSTIKVGDIYSEKEDIYWFEKGVFIISGISVSDTEGKIIQIEGVDKFGLFGNETGFNEMIGEFAISKGSSLIQVVTEILTQDIGNGQKLDTRPPIIDPIFYNFKIPFEIKKGPGAYLSEIFNELATMLKADIFYDNSGRLNIWRTLNFEQYKNISLSWNFYKGDKEYLNPSVTYNINNIVNCICVVGDNPNNNFIPSAIVENTNPNSPLSIQKIGRKTKYIQSSFIQTPQEAQDYAAYQLKQFSVLGHTINFTTTLMPHIEVDQLISITDDSFDYENQNFIVTGLTLPLGPGEISVTGTNVAELPSE